MLKNVPFKVFDSCKSTKMLVKTIFQVCKFFLEAVEKGLYGWFWNCPNGPKCIYRHALPPGFVLKKKQEKEVKDEISFEEFIETEVCHREYNMGTGISWDKQLPNCACPARKSTCNSSRWLDCQHFLSPACNELSVWRLASNLGRSLQQFCFHWVITFEQLLLFPDKYLLRFFMAIVLSVSGTLYTGHQHHSKSHLLLSYHFLNNTQNTKICGKIMRVSFHMCTCVYTYSVVFAIIYHLTSDRPRDSPSNLHSAFFFVKRRIWHVIKSHLGFFSAHPFFLLLAIFIYVEILVFCLQESKAWWKLDKVNIRNILGVEKEKGKLLTSS